MNDKLREQLKHTEARLRHEAIVQLARQKDEAALPLLNDISKHDPEPTLRQLAERAITHILNEFSSTMSRLQMQETPPSKVPPFSNPVAEQHIQKAFALQDSGSNANALQYLIKALDLSPRLVEDFDVQLLAENLTGMEGAEAARLLADPEQRQRFFGNDNSPPPSGKLPTSPSTWIILGLFLVVMSQFFLADGMEFINRAFDELEVQQIKQSAQQVNGIHYYVITPETSPTTGHYPVLIALPDGQETASAMVRHFTSVANDYQTILVIPDFHDYRFTQIELQAATLQMMLDRVASRYPIDPAGSLLFGFGHGAIVATQYANRYPDRTAGVITSGGTFLYPPPDDVPYVIIYGADDELLHGIADNYVPFADLTDWKTPLNYLTVENIGHEINSQQIDIARQVLLDIYQ